MGRERASAKSRHCLQDGPAGRATVASRLFHFLCDHCVVFASFPCVLFRTWTTNAEGCQVRSEPSCEKMVFLHWQSASCQKLVKRRRCVTFFSAVACSVDFVCSLYFNEAKNREKRSSPFPPFVRPPFPSQHGAVGRSEEQDCSTFERERERERGYRRRLIIVVASPDVFYLAASLSLSLSRSASLFLPFSVSRFTVSPPFIPLRGCSGTVENEWAFPKTKSTPLSSPVGIL